MIFRKTFRLLAVSLVCVMVMCRPAMAGLSIAEEREIGQQLLYMVRAEAGLIDEPDIVQYVNRLGGKVLAEVGPHLFDYRFFVVPSDQFNAFAAPSGLIFFYTGLIETMKTEDELLSVMAHEIGHVESRHISSRTDKNAKVGALTMAAALASLALGNPSLSAGMFTGAQAAGLAAVLHFSRVDEEEADRRSYDWMHAMRRDPRGMEDMLRTMRRITRYQTEQVPPYLLTHPNPEARLDYVQSLIDYNRNKVPARYYEQIDNFDFLRMKYRVMALSPDPKRASAFFANVLNSDKGPEEKTMAAYGQAILHGRALDFSRGIETLEEVRKQYPEHSILDVDLGVMYLDSGNTDRALELFKSAYQANPDDMYAAFCLARTYSKTGRNGDAELLFTKVAQAMPEYPQAYFELGRIKSVGGAPWESDLYLAKYNFHSGRLDSAREYLLKVKKNPNASESARKETDDLLESLKKLKQQQ